MNKIAETKDIAGASIPAITEEEKEAEFEVDAGKSSGPSRYTKKLITSKMRKTRRKREKLGRKRNRK